MAEHDSSPSSGLSIPRHGQAKTFSVSLHDHSIDVAEVACSLDGSPRFEGGTEKCRLCGQSLFQKPEKSDRKASAAAVDGGEETETQHGARINYESVLDSRNGSAQPNGSDHCHGTPKSRTNIKAKRSLITASVLCLIFMVGEVVGGYLARSLAIATDAAHLLTDFASFMISLFSMWVADRAPTKRLSFGWHRAEVLGALISVLLIWVVTGVLVYLAVERLASGQYDIDAPVMLITSAVGVAFNLVMGFTLHQQGHGHRHGHSHGGDGERQPLVSSAGHGHGHGGAGSTNINVRAAFIHVVGDLIQSVGVFVAALVIYLRPELKQVDPICTFVFSVIVLLTTVAILKDALTVLMEGLPRGLDFTSVQETLQSIEGVVRVHNLRIWALSMDRIALAAHLVVAPGVATQLVLVQASRRARSQFHVDELTLQIEEFEAGMQDCTQCQDPLA